VPKLTEHLEPEYQRQVKESGSTISPTIVAFHQPSSRESEVFRGLRTTLLFKSNAIGAKAIAVTSPTAGDGKSTVMLNIAMSLAHAGRRVLLIDADMRRPTLAKNLGVDGNMGLSNLLNGEASLTEVVRESGKENLSVILSGPTPENPAELLATQQFKDLIDEAKSEYDIVLIDCPPVLAVADPCVVSSSVDTMLLVLRINSKSKVELKRAISLISAVNASLIGTVVNASKIVTAEGYKMGDYSGYEYGAYTRKPNVTGSTGPSSLTKSPGKNSNALNNGHSRSDRT
jgi:capsular exopolysaccharide synthesis family protein